MMNFLFTQTPLKFLIQGIWRDEGFSYLMARQNLFTIMQTTAKDFNPPLYYFFLHYWMLLFGHSEVVMRSLSLFFFAASIYVVYYFLKDILKINTKRIWIYVMLFSINPFFLYYAFEARMYSLVVLLNLLSFYYLILKKKRSYIIVSTLGLYTHYYFIFVLATQFIYNLLIEKKSLRRTLQSVMYPILFFVPWFFYIYPTISTKTAHFWLTKTNLYNLLISPAVLLTGYEQNYSGFYNIRIILLSLFLFVIVVLFTKRHQSKQVFSLLFLWSFLFYFITLIVSFIKPIFFPRYLIYSAVGFNLLLFYGIEHSRKMIRLILIGVLFIFIADFWSGQILYRIKGKEQETIHSIQKLASNTDLLYVTDAATYFVAAYYFDEKRVYIYKTDSKPIAYYIGLVLIPQNKIVTYLPLFPKKAFILTSDQNYEIKTSN